MDKENILAWISGYIHSVKQDIKKEDHNVTSYLAGKLTAASEIKKMIEENM